MPSSWEFRTSKEFLLGEQGDLVRVVTWAARTREIKGEVQVTVDTDWPWRFAPFYVKRGRASRDTLSPHCDPKPKKQRLY